MILDETKLFGVQSVTTAILSREDSTRKIRGRKEEKKGKPAEGSADVGEEGKMALIGEEKSSLTFGIRKKKEGKKREKKEPEAGEISFYCAAWDIAILWERNLCLYTALGTRMR